MARGLRPSSPFTGVPLTDVLALIENGAECTPIYGNPSKFGGEIKATDGHEGQMITLTRFDKQVSTDQQASSLMFSSAYFPPPGGYFGCGDLIWIYLPTGEFRLCR